MTTPKPAKSPGNAQHGSFYGDGGTLFGMAIVNLLLIIATLGIYTFWAKAKVRRYMYSQTEFAGDRFAYHGTGKELFIGALKAFGLMIGFYVVFFLLAAFASPLLAMAFIYIGIAAAIPLALYGSMRFAMSRTSWRSIRFSFRGRLGECYTQFLGGILLSAITLGIYLPFFHSNMRRYWANNTYFGNTAFGYDGKGKDLVWHYLLAIVLTIPTLGLYWIWYSARQMRYDWGRTRFTSGKFSSTVTGGSVLWLAFSNFLLMAITLGFALPWIRVRNMRFILERIALNGQVNWTAVMADARAPKVGATGEMLADGLDVGVAVT